MKYKVKIARVTPSSSKLESKTIKKCYLGISMNSQILEEPKLSSIIDWLSNNYDECQIVIGDYLNRINEYILFGHDKSDAIDKSLYLGELFKKQFENDIDKYPNEKFSILSWYDLIKNSNYDKLKKYFYDCYNNNLEFKDRIHYTSEKYVEKQIIRGSLFINRDDAVKISAQYIIEELAGFSLLITLGYRIQVYPGSILEIIKDFVNGEFPEISTNLREGIFIELKLSTKKS